MNNARLRMFARAAVIAALYTVLTLAIPVASYGQIQPFRDFNHIVSRYPLRKPRHQAEASIINGK